MGIPPHNCDALRPMCSHKLLTREQEQQLFADLKRHARGSAEWFAIREQIVLPNIRLVVSLAKRGHIAGAHLEDRIDDGIIGLLTAVEKYDVSRGHRFSTYATFWIRQAMRRENDNAGWMIHVPTYLHVALRRREAMTQKTGREPDEQELAEAVKMPVKRLRLLADGERANQCNYFTDGREAYLLAHSSPFAEVEDREDAERLRRAVSRLLPRERLLMTLRWGLNGQPAMTLEQTGEVLGLTKERVRQIQAECLKRLRELLEERSLAWSAES